MSKMKLIVFVILVSIRLSALTSEMQINLNEAIYKSNQLALKKQFSEALEIAQILYKKYPHNQKVIHLNAKLYFWNHNLAMAYKYGKNITEVSKLFSNIETAYTIQKLQQIKQPKKILQAIEHLESKFQENYMILIMRIQAYLKLDDFSSAKEYAKKLVRIYPKSDEAKGMLHNINKWQKNSLKSRSVTQRMVGIGYKYSEYSHNNFIDEVKYFEISSELKQYLFYLKLLHSKRFDLQDNSIEGEIYLNQKAPYWGYVSFGMTDDADFSSQYYLGWHQYIVINKWQLNVSYKYVKYPQVTTHLTTLEYAYYFNDSFSWKQSLYISLPTQDLALLSEVHYKTKKHFETFISCTFSDSSKEGKGITTNIGLEYPLSFYYSLGFSMAYNQIELPSVSYNKTDLGIFMRGYF